MPLALITGFVNGSLQRRHRWDRIRVLGGEPTLHPQFHEIIEELLRYKAWHTACRIEVVTNGHGDRVVGTLAGLPEAVWIENSRKDGSIQPEFGPFNLAPIDDPRYAQSDFRNGCAIMSECGMGLTPLGYYPCAIAGGIDRISGDNLGHKDLPANDDDMAPLLRAFCRLCGRFRDGHYVPLAFRPPLREAKISPSWHRLYENWRDRRGPD